MNYTSVYPTVPVTDIKKARDFYENKVGLTSAMDVGPDGAMYKVGSGMLYVYERPTASSGDHTYASIMVPDIEQAVDELTEKGVVFEQYDMKHLKTDEKGIADQGPVRAAWFKDPDGNILAIVQQK